MDKPTTATEDWFIVFTRSKLDHWLIKRFPRSFQHCYAVKESAGGQFWIVLDSRSSHLQSDIYAKMDYPHIRQLCNERSGDCVILPIRAKIDINQNRWTFCIFNCVEVCKSVIGVRAFWLWTPYQLYKYLRGHYVN